jgi:hypothetical protein
MRDPQSILQWANLKLDRWVGAIFSHGYLPSKVNIGYKTSQIKNNISGTGTPLLQEENE